MNQEKIVKKLSFIGIFGNVVLSAFKLFAGFFGHSGAMVSDAVHSLSDVFATLIAFLGVRLSGKGPDDRHPYGHDRFECIAAIVLGLFLAVTGLGIGYGAVRKILSGKAGEMEIPTLLPLIAAVVSILVKEGMFRYTLYYAKKMNSSAFVADAWHHRSDALSSVGSFAGILAARLGLPVMEPVASVLISLFILKTAADIELDAFMRMMDTSCGSEYEKKLRTYIAAQPGVLSVDLLRTRYFGSRIYADMEIGLDPDLSLTEAHRIAEDLHRKVEGAFPSIKHIMIHVNPAKKL